MIGRGNMSAVLIAHRSHEIGQRRFASAIFQGLGDQRQGVRALAEPGVRHGLVEPRLWLARIHPQCRVEVGIGRLDVRTAQQDNPTVDERADPLFGRKRLLGQCMVAIVEGTQCGASSLGSFIAGHGIAAAHGDHRGTSGHWYCNYSQNRQVRELRHTTSRHLVVTPRDGL